MSDGSCISRARRLFLFVEERNEFVSFHYWHVIQYRRRDSGEFLCWWIPSDIKIIQIRSMKLYNIILMSIKDGKKHEFNAISRLRCSSSFTQTRLLSGHFSNQRRQLMCSWNVAIKTRYLQTTFSSFFERLRLRISIAICSSSRVWMFDLSTPWSLQQSSLRTFLGRINIIASGWMIWGGAVCW